MKRQDGNYVDGVGQDLVYIASALDGGEIDGLHELDVVLVMTGQKRLLLFLLSGGSAVGAPTVNCSGAW